jgi:spermidine/putrescine transport system permease protein
MGERWRTWLLLAPATLWLGLLLVLPVAVLVVFSLGERAPAGGYAPGLTLTQFLNLPSRGKAFANTLVLAPVGTILTLLAAYPLAYWLALRAPRRHRLLLLVLVILPFWTSLLIRLYAWMFILGSKGLPSLLALLGLPGVRLVNTPFAVLVGVVYAYLPLMVEASADLGASPWRSFLQVTLPLSMPGVATGVMLVLILLMGEFLIPALLGGGKVFFVGNALVDLFLQSRNWPFGAAMALSLVAIMLLAALVHRRLARAADGRARGLL